MKISAQQVKGLREMSDAPMMDCKRALEECGGDVHKALEYLRQKGLSKAIKKADRLATEGVIALEVCGDQATMLEINSETDFVAKNDHFKALVQRSLEVAKGCSSVEALYQVSLGQESFEQYLHSVAAIIGENIVIRRLVQMEAGACGIVRGYLHANHKVGVLVKISCQNKDNAPAICELGDRIAMHTAAMKPVALSYKAFSSDFIAKERVALIAEIEKDNEEAKRLGKPLKTIPQYVSRAELSPALLQAQEELYKQELREQKKPEKIFEKILPGKMERFIADNTLLDQRLTLLGQFFVMDEKKTIQQVLEGESKVLGDCLEIVEFVRFEVGEGLEKKNEDFAAEVAAQMR